MLLSNVKFKQYSALLTKKGRDKSLEFLIDGLNNLKMASDSGHLKAIIYLNDEDYLQIKDFKVDIYQATSSQFSALSQVSHGTYVGVCEYFELPLKSKQRLLVCEDLQDPINLALLVRSALAFSFDGVIISNLSVDKYHARFINASQGALFYLPIIKTDLKAFLSEFKEHGGYVIGTNLHENSTYKLETKLDKFVLLLGNEGHGLSASLNEYINTNLLIKIDNIDSLNVAVSGAILMHYLVNL
jgi:TrmH family RNA methyltransferase